MRHLQPLDSSTDLLGDADRLRDRLVEDGYLFLPGLLPRERVLEVRQEILRVMSKIGWLEDGTDPLDERPGPNRTDRDPDWFEGYVQILAVEAFNRLPHSDELLSVVRAIVGDPVIVHPQKIARVTFPGSDYPTLPHQDFLLIQGAADTLTSWIPLGDTSSELGSLRILAGSHREGLRSVRAAEGMGNLVIDGVDMDDPRWRGIDHFSPGDVLLFHSLTVHEAPGNKGAGLRLSGDFRFQNANDPIAPGPLLPTGFGGGHGQGWWPLTKGWSTTAWVDLEHPVKIVSFSRDPLSTPPSRLLGTD